MTSSEAAGLLSILHGAFPGVFIDESVADAFANSFITNQYDASKQAVHEWVNTMDRFPTIAELNRIIRRIKNDHEEAKALPVPLEKANINVAKEAFANGYRRARERAGDDEETIARKLESHMNRRGGMGIQFPDA